MPQLSSALMDAIIVSLIIFVSLNDYFNSVEQTSDGLSLYNLGVVIG